MTVVFMPHLLFFLVGEQGTQRIRLGMAPSHTPNLDTSIGHSARAGLGTEAGMVRITLSKAQK